MALRWCICKEQVAAGEKINNEPSRVFAKMSHKTKFLVKRPTAKAQEEGKIRKKLKHNVGRRTKPRPGRAFFLLSNHWVHRRNISGKI